jgi:multicomponent Na+:H+ antiporter subunit E
MIPFLITTFAVYIAYLILTAGSGTIGVWSASELVAGVAISLVVGAVSRTFFCANRNYRMLNPFRWLVLALYLVIPFFLEMARANLDVAYRVITGRIRPGIVRLSAGLKTDLSILLLANSITLTPGTLTVDVDEESGDLFVHMIHIGMGTEEKEIFEGEDVFMLFKFPGWIRRIAE